MCKDKGEYLGNTKTPGCTDYSPKFEIRKKSPKKFAPQTQGRFFNKTILDHSPNPCPDHTY
jgi:hypothetical protein